MSKLFFDLIIKIKMIKNYLSRIVKLTLIIQVDKLTHDWFDGIISKIYNDN
jgi:hypothetical protein